MSQHSEPLLDELPQAYPSAERLDLVEVLHGHRVADPYRWLEDAADPRTAEWSTCQDELFATFQRTMQDDGAHENLRSRFARLLDTGYVDTPVWRGRRRFFLRRRAGQEHNVLMTAGADDVERALVDPAAIDPSGLTTLDDWYPSPDGSLLAYLSSEGGTEESVLRVIDVDGGELVDGPIDRVKYSSIAWLPDGKAFYYVRRLAAHSVPEGESEFHRRVYLHRLATDSADDVLVFGAGREKANYYQLSISADGRWLAVISQRGTAPRNDVHLADLAGTGPDRPQFTAVQEGVDAQTYPSFGRDGRLYLSTTLDAPNSRLCVVDPAQPDRANWREILAEDPDAVLRGFAVLEGSEPHLPVLLALRSRLTVSELTLHEAQDGTRLAPIPTPGAGVIGDMADEFVAENLNTHPDGGSYAWFSYTDDVTPVRIYRFDARSRELTLWTDSASEFELGSVHVTRSTYQSKDGTSVQLTILSPTGEPDRPRPTILYGYGGFSVSLGPVFSAMRLAWVEAGGVYAFASLRGGGEQGETWHRAGMFESKQNTFDDFHAAGDLLVEQGWTTRGQLGISGGSNGGLLVGAALTQRPEAYAAVLCTMPLLDMLRYELFGLGATWNVEYGSASVPEEFGWLLGYSPYHHVREDTTYPATLFVVSEGDTRVDPLHARKLAAALQHASSAGLAERPILLRREQGTGHADRAVSRLVDVVADQLGFLARQLGLDPTSDS